jgi:hypothetical protein
VPGSIGSITPVLAVREAKPCARSYVLSRAAVLGSLLIVNAAYSSPALAIVIIGDQQSWADRRGPEEERVRKRGEGS